MAKIYNRIKYYRLEVNSGAGIARSMALKFAKGRYVAFIDSDDIWEINKINTQITHMKNEHMAFCYSSVSVINETGKLIKKKRKIKKYVNYRFLLHNTIIPTSTVVIDRYIIGDFQMSNRRGGQDYATWLSILRNGFIALGIDECLCKYRCSSDSLSSNKFKSFKQVWDIQTKDEKISKLVAFFNVIRFGINAALKHLF